MCPVRVLNPLAQNAVEKFFDHLDKKRVKWANHPNPSQVKRLSLGAIRAVGSAIFHLYRIHALAVCDRLKFFFNNFNRYHILNIAQDKAHVPPLFPSSGSSEAISVEAYQLLCLRAWQYTPDTLTGQGTGRNWANCRSLPLYFTQAKPLMSRRERLVRTQLQFVKKMRITFVTKHQRQRVTRKALYRIGRRCLLCLMCLSVVHFCLLELR